MVFDTVGMENYNSMSASYVRKCDYCLVVAAVDDERSLQNVFMWSKFVRDHQPECGLILALNKSDVPADTKRDKAWEEAHQKELACFSRIVRCSAKTGENVPELFNMEFHSSHK